MGYSIQNTETGEVDYIRCDVSTAQPQEFDEETGEPLIGELKVRYVKHNRFQIPKKYLRSTMCEEFEKEMTGDYLESFQPSDMQQTPANAAKQNRQYNKEYYMNIEGVKNEIILGYNKNNMRLFLIPTLIFFNIYVAIVLALLEIFFHIWAHKQNGLNMNKQIYYRSPMHLLTSQFCALCRSESEMEIEIFQMLNQQMRKARETEKGLWEVAKIIT